MNIRKLSFLLFLTFALFQTGCNSNNSNTTTPSETRTPARTTSPSVTSTPVRTPSPSATTTPMRTTSPSETAPPSADWPNVEQLIIDKVNNHRTATGLSKLQFDSKLTEQARIHSTNMATGRTAYGHDGFSSRVAAAGYSNCAAGENVHRTGPNASSDPEFLANYAVNGWLNSSGHRQNIEGNYNLIGVGIAKSSSGEYFFTQIFVKK